MRSTICQLLCWLALSLLTTSRNLYSEEGSLWDKAFGLLLHNADKYMGFTAQEREQNEQILKVCKQFLVEDGNTHWKIKEPLAVADSRLFIFFEPNASNLCVSLAVNIIDMEKHRDIFSQWNVEAIWEDRETKNKNQPFIDGRSYFNVLETSPNHMIYEWVFIGDEQRKMRPKHRLVRFEVDGSQLIYKRVINEKRLLTQDEVSLWLERFKKIPA